VTTSLTGNKVVSSLIPPHTTPLQTKTKKTKKRFKKKPLITNWINQIRSQSPKKMYTQIGLTH